MIPGAGRLDATRIRFRLPGVVLALGAGAVTVYLAFNSGGFFAQQPAAVAIVLLLVLIGRVLFVARPARGSSRSLQLAVGGLAAFAIWTLLSSRWSAGPSRALISFDRVLLYLVAVVVWGSAGGELWRVRWLLRGLALAIVGVAGAALITRLLPDVWPIDYISLSARLSYPLTYWNSLGLLAALGVVICVGLTCDESEPRIVRVLGAAATPILSCALLLTLSRAAIGAGVLGVLVLVVLGRPRGLPSGLVVSVVTSGIALVTTWHADLVVSDKVNQMGFIIDQSATPAGRAQGHHVALILGFCVVAAALVRAILLRADDVMSKIRLSAHARRLGAVVAVGVAIAALLGGALAVNLSGQYNRFLGASKSGARASGGRNLLLDPTNDGRVAQWQIAIDQFKATPLRGSGAGTYVLDEDLRQKQSGGVNNAPLYPEVLAELGIVGIFWLSLAIIAIVVGVARRVRGPNRALFATILGAGLSWLFAAGVDFHWELTAVTFWFFALAGTALAASEPALPPTRYLAWPPRLVIAAALGLLIVVVPTHVTLSQTALGSATAEYYLGRCDRATSSAADSIRALGGRPQPYVILGACDLVGHHDARAVSEFRAAVGREPGAAILRSNLAVALARTGHDPRPTLAAALRLDPLDPDLRRAITGFNGRTGARAWRKASRSIPILIPPPT